MLSSLSDGAQLPIRDLDIVFQSLGIVRGYTRLHVLAGTDGRQAGQA